MIGGMKGWVRCEGGGSLSFQAQMQQILYSGVLIVPNNLRIECLHTQSLIHNFARNVKDNGPHTYAAKSSHTLYE